MKLYTREIIDSIYKNYEHGTNGRQYLNIHYRNMPGYRISNLPYVMNYEEKVEWSKCYKDPIYFIETYCTINTPDGISNVSLFDFQKAIIEDFLEHRFNVIMNSRQTGLSTIMGYLMLWVAMFSVDKVVALLSDKQCNSVEIIDNVRRNYAGLPFFLKPGVMDYSQKHIRFDNGCRIIGLSTVAAISFGIDNLFIQDYVYIHPNVIAAVYPTMISNKRTSLFIQSTPKGYDQFHGIFTKAEQGYNSFNARRVYWWQVPGRDEKWKEDQIRNLGSCELFAQEYELQFVVFRHKKESN